MFCPECGKEIEGDSKFCEHCGNAIEDGINEETPVKNEKLGPIDKPIEENPGDKQSKKEGFIICSDCGKQVREGSIICSNCGNRIESDVKEETPAENIFGETKKNIDESPDASPVRHPDSKTGKIILVVSAILICIIIFIILIKPSNMEKGNEALKNDKYQEAIAFFEQVSPDSKDYEEAQTQIRYARGMIIQSELRRYETTKDIDGLDNFIQQHSGTEYEQKARDIRTQLMEYFHTRQLQFENTQLEFAEQYASGRNDVARSNTFNESNRWSANFMKEDNYRFYDWQGTLLTLSTTKGGNSVSAKINSNNIIYIIDLTSSDAVYEKLASVETWEKVRFSGVFKVGSDGRLQENSWTEVGKMLNPELKIQLTDISMDIPSSVINRQPELGDEVSDSTLNDSANTTEAGISPSFDCKKATTDAERLICSSKALAGADVEMAQAYKAARSRSADKQGLKQEQLSWLKNVRGACTDENAMLKVYQERIEQLSTR